MSLFLRLLAVDLFIFDSLRLGFIFRWNISVICPMIVSKLAITVFTSLPFQTSSPNLLNFFGHLKKLSLWPKNDRKNKPRSQWSSSHSPSSWQSCHSVACLLSYLEYNPIVPLRLIGSLAQQTDPLRMGVGRGSCLPWILKFDIFLSNFQQKKFF